MCLNAPDNPRAIAAAASTAKAIVAGSGTGQALVGEAFIPSPSAAGTQGSSLMFG